MAEFESTRRRFSIGIATALGLSLAGCTSGDGDEDPTDTEPPTDSPTDTPEPTDTPTEEPTDTPTPEPEEYTLSVMVQSAAGANPPVEEATVSVNGEEVGETDIDGVVEATVEAGDHSVLAEKLRYENGEADVTVEEGDADVTVSLQPVEPDGEASLALGFENEDGENVEVGMDVIAEHLGGYDRIERSYVGKFDETDHFGGDGEYKAARMRLEPEVLNPITLEFAGEWELRVEPNEENDFEPHQETIEYTQTDLEDGAEKTRSIVLDGAMSENERWREDSLVLDGEQHHIDGNHDPTTEWALTGHAGEENVDQQEWSGSDDQLWNFELVGDEEDKWHRIVNEDSGLVWDATYNPEEDLNAWTEVKTAEWDESDNQLWRIRPVHPEDPEVEEGDELYRIEGKVHANDERFDYGAAAGPEGGGVEPGTRVITWWYAASPDQQLFLSPYE